MFKLVEMLKNETKRKKQSSKNEVAFKPSNAFPTREKREKLLRYFYHQHINVMKPFLIYFL